MDEEKSSWLQLALQLRGSVVKVILPRVILSSLFGFGIAAVYNWGLPVSWHSLGSVINNVAFNLVLGLLLVFRTNTAYDKFWEGRRIWGTLVVSARNLTRQMQVAITALDPAEQAEKAAAMKLLAAFAIATKIHLRREKPNEELKNLLSPAQYNQLLNVQVPPLQIALWIDNYLQQQVQRDRLRADRLISMNILLDSMVEALTGCERILNTPLPPAYSIYLKRLLLIYCIFLPFQVVEDMRWWTGVVVAAIVFVLFGIEAVGSEIENPFGYDANDLPLDEICAAVLHNIDAAIAPPAGENLLAVELSQQT